MRKISFLIFLMLCTGNIFAQNINEVELFSENLNKFVNVRDLALSVDGDEAFFTIQSPDQDISQIVTIKKKKGKWGSETLLAFCDEFSYLEPFLTKDGKRLFFVSDRPLDDKSKTKKDFDIWYVERRDKNSAWSKPINLGEPINSKLDEFYPTLAANGNLYFTLDSPKGLGKDDIYMSKFVDGKYAEPELLDANINSDGFEFNAFITPDEQFLIYTKYNAAGGLGSGDLYVANKTSDGKWNKPLNLGDKINTKFMEYCPFYDQTKKMLYFTSRRANLKRKKFNSVDEFQVLVNGGGNGFSKIYKVPFEIHSMFFQVGG